MKQKKSPAAEKREQTGNNKDEKHTGNRRSKTKQNKPNNNETKIDTCVMCTFAQRGAVGFHVNCQRFIDIKRMKADSFFSHAHEQRVLSVFS